MNKNNRLSIKCSLLLSFYEPGIVIVETLQKNRDFALYVSSSRTIKTETIKKSALPYFSSMWRL